MPYWIGVILACVGEGKRDRPPGVADSATDSGAPTGSSAPARARNVLIVLADDLGTDKVAGYAEHPAPPPTPNIDALAAAGVLFRNAWGYPSCSPGRASVLTGRYGRRTGIGDVVDPDSSYSLPEREVTLAEVLPANWSTSLVGKWHLAGYGAPELADGPGTQGFGWFSVSLSNLQDTPEPDDGYYHWMQDQNGVLSWQSTYATTVQVDQALARIAVMPEPWAMVLLLNAPHTPYDLPPSELYDVPVEPYWQPDYQAAIVQAMDAEVGRLLSGVDLHDTLVLFASDNGTAEQAITPPRDPSEGKLTTFEGGINVPLVVAGPGVARGAESTALVHLVDLFATVADVGGVSINALTGDDGVAIPIDGQSLLPLAADPTRSGRTTVYTETFRPLGTSAPRTNDERVVRDGRFKLVSNEVSGLTRLYDLAGRNDDGPDLLAAGELAPEAATALVTLTASLQEFRATLVPQPAP